MVYRQEDCQNQLIRTDGLKSCDRTEGIRRVGAGWYNLGIRAEPSDPGSSWGNEAKPWIRVGALR